MPAQRLSGKLLTDVDRAVEAIRGTGPADEPAARRVLRAAGRSRAAASSWARGFRRGREPIESTVFEDHEGASITFEEFFRGHPSIVVFFYTRCDNPLKCSLTVTKLARVQQLLEARGLADRIQHRGDHLRSRRSISPNASAATGRAAACEWTPAIECCGRRTGSTPCAATSGSGSTSSSRW